ncbi:MAG: carboxylating nicotinate-nucleotide diphosphorylase [Kiritimatiellae bacterium]|nr:carboxylating nicotinate-nucleotide diphosphorylase [Kiritimatiellia bacterium]
MNLPDLKLNKQVLSTIKLALDEDLAGGVDVTSVALVPEDAVVTADLLARESLTVAGVDVAVAVFEAVDSTIKCEVLIADGSAAELDDVILKITGPAVGILTAERTALNFMQRMCGIATMTKSFVNEVAGTDTMILDTRKTTPTLRIFEKYSVLCGGGDNHRMGLYDRVLIKDNHRQLWRGGDESRLDKAVVAARERFPNVVVEVEIETEEELKSALLSKPEWILLDNMGPADLKRCVEICGGVSKLEASGGITLDNVLDIAKSGVDAVSLGCLTHSAPSADLSLEMA